MDAEGARELTRRLGPNAGLPLRALPVDVPANLVPLSRWFAACAAASATEPSPPKKRPRRSAKPAPADAAAAATALPARAPRVALGGSGS